MIQCQLATFQLRWGSRQRRQRLSSLRFRHAISSALARGEAVRNRQDGHCIRFDAGLVSHQSTNSNHQLQHLGYHQYLLTPPYPAICLRNKGGTSTVDKILSSEDVGFKLRMIRQKAELTQEQLAERVGVSTFQIRKYESGRDNINVEKLQLFAAVFSVPVQEFFTENSEVIPLQVSERVLLESFRAIQNANVRESILQVVIHAAKVKE